MAVLLLDHVPPKPDDVSVIVAPVVTLELPDIVPAEGDALTVITAVTAQPPGIAYVIVVVPAASPDTTPVVLTVATAVLLLLHDPPDVVFDKAVVPPVQTVVEPPIAAGVALTVIDLVAVQPEPVE